MRRLATLMFLGVAAMTWSACGSMPGEQGGQRPNVLVILTDDQGYGDLGCQGATGFDTPHVDRLAREGLRLTSAYVPGTVCTPSRAGLLTGCYPKRVGLHEAVLFPFSETGLHPDEVTLAEVLRAQGYATGCIGKWHLGHHEPFLPHRQGFDEVFSVPYSNDMDGHLYRQRKFQSPPLPLYRGDELVESGPDQDQLTGRFSAEAVSFVERHDDEPWFLYLAHVMPHRPLHVSERHRGSSVLGIYGDVLQEIDAGVGDILAALERTGQAENTIVVFTSDNGPVLGDRRGASAGPLRGAKGSTWEGGPRVPFVVRWPAGIPAGAVSDGTFSTIDILPTVAALAGSTLSDRVLDGVDQSGLWRGGESARDEMLFYARNGRPEAIRVGRFKLHVAKTRGWNARKDGAFGARLYDLDADPGESDDVAAKHPEVVERLRARLARRDAALSAAARPVGKLNSSHP